jgi:hypothetical protein
MGNASRYRLLAICYVQFCSEGILNPPLKGQGHEICMGPKWHGADIPEALFVSGTQ